MKSYFNQIAELLNSLGNVSSFNQHRPDTGSNREEVLIDELNKHLPDCLTAINGGNIINIEGNHSRQIDIIIKNNLFPKFEQNKKTSVITESVAGVISVKSFLDRNTLEEAIENVASVPKFSKETLSLSNSSIIRNDLQEKFTAYWPYRAVFAYDSIDANTLHQYALEYYNSHLTRLADFPKMIIVNRKICIRYLSHGGAWQNWSPISRNHMPGMILTPEIQGYPIGGIITEINNYVPWMHYMKCNFSLYIDKAFAA